MQVRRVWTSNAHSSRHIVQCFYKINKLLNWGIFNNYVILLFICIFIHERVKLKVMLNWCVGYQKRITELFSGSVDCLVIQTSTAIFARISSSESVSKWSVSGIIYQYIVYFWNIRCSKIVFQNLSLVSRLISGLKITRLIW